MIIRPNSTEELQAIRQQRRRAPLPNMAATRGIRVWRRGFPWSKSTLLPFLTLQGLRAKVGDASPAIEYLDFQSIRAL